jgi:hypothetical protein
MPLSWNEIKDRALKFANSVMTCSLPLLMVSFGILAAEAHDDFLRQFVVGEYHLVGKQLDSSMTYLGHATIYMAGSQLMVKRTIAGHTFVAQGSVEKALDNARVLRIRFLQDQAQMEQTCLISSDLDNYARITCYSYSPHRLTADPGLEAYFHVKP